MKVQSGNRVRAGIEPVARVQSAVPVEVISRPVERVGSGLDSDIDNRARLPSVIGFRAGLHVEFLNRVNRQVRRGRSFDAFRVDHRGAVIRVIVVEAIDHVVVVFGTVSVRGSREKSASRGTLNTGLQDLPGSGSRGPAAEAH